MKINSFRRFFLHSSLFSSERFVFLCKLKVQKSRIKYCYLNLLPMKINRILIIEQKKRIS